MGPFIGAGRRRRGACVEEKAALGLLPPFQQRESLQAYMWEIISVNTGFIHFPAAILLQGKPCFLQECDFRQQRSIATEDYVNLLIFFAVCVSRQVKLINRGRNVTIQGFDKQKQIFAQLCWLLPFTWDCKVLGAVHALMECGPTLAALSFILLLLSPSSAAESFVPGLRGGSDWGRGRKGKCCNQDAQQCDTGRHPGYLCRRDVFCNLILAESHFLVPQGWGSDLCFVFVIWFVLQEQLGHMA